MNKRKPGLNMTAAVLVWAVTAGFFTSATAQAAEASLVTAPDSLSAFSIKNDEPTSERIQQWIDTAMYFYWHGGDLKQAEKDIFKGVTLKGKYDVVENAFKEAVNLDPYNMNLKFSLASAQIVQQNIPGGLRTYRQILQLDPNNFNANLLYALYSKISGDEASYDQYINKIRKIDSSKAKDFEEKFKAAEQWLQVTIHTDLPAGLPQQHHAIVILGYALADDGSMREPLIGRLEQGLRLAVSYPNSKIIVTGGVPKNGVTEADQMSRWLIEKGMDPSRIIKEDKSTDTVENALFTSALMSNEGITDVTVVTSASHIRRALVLFTEASGFYDKMNGAAGERKFTNLVYMDYPSMEEAMKVTQAEKTLVYRDLLRTAGIWQYPGIQR